MSERSERLAASEASLAEKVVRSTTDQLVNNKVVLGDRKKSDGNKPYFWA